MDTTYGRHFTVDRPGCQVHCWLTGPGGYRLPVPALLILGEKDRTGDIAKSMPAWAAREPQAGYAVIAGAGHCSNYDQPAQVNDIIRPFLQRSLPG